MIWCLTVLLIQGSLEECCEFSALTLLVGHSAHKETEWWGAGVVICRQRDADLYMAQLMSLPLASVKDRLDLPFQFYLSGTSSPGQSQTKGLFNGCV